MKVSIIFLLFLFLLTLIGNQGDIIHSTINLSSWSYEFHPGNSIELIDTIFTLSILKCVIACNLHFQCRTFDYDSSSNICRLFEGAVNTGDIIPSISSSRVGSIQLFENVFTNFGESCSECLNNRYLICLYNICQCPLNTFWNGILCENQRYIGDYCNNNQWCRIGLICSVYNICQMNTTINWTTTTIITPNCSATCVSDTTVWSVPILARWTFENTYEDSILKYNGTAINSPSFITGYVGQGLSLDSSLDQYLSTSFIPLNSQSFTIDVWVYPTGYPNEKGTHSIVGLCPQRISPQCLEVMLQSNGTNTSSTTDFGFWHTSNSKGKLPIYLNQWTHIAFIYSKNTTKQSTYVNGIFDDIHTQSNDFNATSGLFYIGNNVNLNTYPLIGKNNFQGYIDQLTISSGVRSPCELLNVATLAAHFTFDNTSNIFDDSGPNTVLINASNYQTVSDAKGGQAIALSGLSSSYLIATGFRFLSFNDSAFSLTLWIQPTILQGTLISSSLGYSFLAFNSNGSLIARIGSTSIQYNNPIQSGSVWTHIVQTWSSSNGIRLYVNNQLVAITSSATFIGSDSSSNSLTIGGGTYVGSIDEWRVYSRELTPQDVCALFIA